MRELPLNRLRSYLDKLVADSSASILPLFGIMVILIIVASGAAVDITRAVNAREKLSYALDAAALSLAADLSTSLMDEDDIKLALEGSLRANLGDVEFLDEALENLTYKLEPDKGLLIVTSSASLDNYFIDLGGYMKEHIGPEMFTFGTNSQVTYSRYDVELAMVIDVTLSMKDEIGDLKTAAESAVDILIPEGTTGGKVKISIIPYSQGVNLGDYAAKVTNNLSSKCVTERDGDEKHTDASYSEEYFGDGVGTKRGFGCSDAKLVPLTDDRTTLLAAITALKVNGYTAGQTGIGWGWYSLSPNWSDLWPENSVPAAYDDDDVLKFALIMTDGDFNTHYDLETLTESECEDLKDDHDYLGTCKNGTNDYWLEKAQSGYYGEASQRAITICDEMKDDKIEIYSIYYGDDSYSDAAKVMQECADEGNYYQASSSDKLIGAFSNIARKIQQIYISG